MTLASRLDVLERLLAHGLRRDARRAEVSEATARLLLALEAREQVPMGELAARIGRDPSTATRFADRAAKEGRVARVPGLDRRRRLIGLTEEGRAARERLLRLRRERAERATRALGDGIGLDGDQVEWFLEALSRALRA